MVGFIRDSARKDYKIEVKERSFVEYSLIHEDFLLYAKPVIAII